MTKQYTIMGYQTKGVRFLIYFWFICCHLVVNGQNSIISLERNGNVLLNDSTLNSVFFDVDRISFLLGENYKVCRLKRPNIRFYNFKFKASYIDFLSISSKEKIRFSREFSIRFRKKKKRKFEGEFYFFGKRLDWNTTFDELYTDEKYKKFIDTDIYANPNNPSKYLMHIYYSDYFMSLWFHNDKDTYKLETIDFRIINHNFKKQGKKT